jgi:hypothetical protein
MHDVPSKLALWITKQLLNKGQDVKGSIWKPSQRFLAIYADP